MQEAHRFAYASLSLNTGYIQDRCATVWKDNSTRLEQRLEERPFLPKCLEWVPPLPQLEITQNAFCLTEKWGNFLLALLL
jgi:hypothetical protein